MMTKKRKNTVIILVIFMILLVIAITLIVLYLTTDMFKSNQRLFTKYMVQNFENAESIYSQIGKSKQTELLEKNRHQSETTLKLNCTENIGTSLENAKNPINKLKIVANGEIDKQNKYNYQDIKLLKEDEEISKIEYIQSVNTYGIKLPDIPNQFILVENENLKDLFKKIGYEDENLTNIPDKIEINNIEILEELKFSKEEKQMLLNKYLNLINANVSKSNFSKQANKIIQIDGKRVKVNAYVLQLTKEQLNNIYIKILEEIKQEEIVLKRIDKVQEFIAKTQECSSLDLRKEFAESIDNYISEIVRNNIGKDKCEIIVYESAGVTVSTNIETPEYDIYIDMLNNQVENYIQISYKSKISSNEQENLFTYKKTDSEAFCSIKNKINEETTECSFIVNEKNDGNNYTKDIIAKFEDNQNRVEIDIEQKNIIVNTFENEMKIQGENNIKLNEVDSERISAVLNRVGEAISKEVTEITTNGAKLQDLLGILKVTGIIKEEQLLQAIGVTDTERNRFNSRIEILQGEELANTDILKLIEAVRENLNGIEVVSNTELKLKLDKIEKNEEIANVLTNFIEQRKNDKYNVKVEYNEITGLVSDVVLTIVEKK